MKIFSQSGIPLWLFSYLNLGGIYYEARNEINRKSLWRTYTPA